MAAGWWHWGRGKTRRQAAIIYYQSEEAEGETINGQLQPTGRLSCTYHADRHRYWVKIKIKNKINLTSFVECHPLKTINPTKSEACNMINGLNLILCSTRQNKINRAYSYTDNSVYCYLADTIITYSIYKNHHNTYTWSSSAPHMSSEN